MSGRFDSYDVAVVGAGLAGLYTSRLLAAYGLRVLLIDRKASLHKVVQTTGIFVRRTLVDFSLPEDCLGPAIRHVTLYSPSRRALELESLHDEFRIGRMGRLYARLLEDGVASGVTFAGGSRYLGSVPEHGSSLIFLQDAKSIRGVRARFIVGADGCSSRVARDLRLDENRAWIVALEDVFDGPLDGGAPRLHCFLDARLAPGYIAWVAGDGFETHLGVGGYPSHFDPSRALAEFKSLVRRTLGLRLPAPRERRGGRIPVGGVLHRIANRRGLLVGDAAGAPSPLTAGGLDPCLRLSRMAAQVAMEFMKSGDEQVLAAFSGRRFRARFVSRLGMRCLFDFLTSRPTLDWFFEILRWPVARKAAARVFFGPRSFPDLEILSRQMTRQAPSREFDSAGDNLCIPYRRLPPSSRWLSWEPWD